MIRNRKRYLLVGICLTCATLSAGDLDLTEIASSQVRSRLQTVLPKICSGLEAPAFLFSRPAKSAVLITGRYNMPDLRTVFSEFPVVPTFGLAVGVTPSITMAGQLGTGRWQDESLNSMGFHLAYLWRNISHPGQIICGISHIKGPTDFHFRDVSLGYLKMFLWKYWDLSLTGTVHFTQVDIHVTDHVDSTDDYKTSKKIEFGLVSIGLNRNISEHLKVGTNLTISTKSISGGFSVGGYF